jgi:protocatechuate 3,4-dioxygenase beta subunit
LSYLFIVASISWFSCIRAQSQNQDRHVGGPCEGCEAVYEYSDRPLSSSITLPGYDTAQTKLIIYGVVFEKDGHTPADDVVLYFYHTDANGIYQPSPGARGWEKRHGALRGWLRTDNNGAYEIKTNRPASYPNRNIPAHIHVTIKEHGLTPYYITDYYYSDDPFLTDDQRDPKNARGGSGVLHLIKNGVHWTGERNIILGKNIPDY